jgi:hypothetical protein
MFLSSLLAGILEVDVELIALGDTHCASANAGGRGNAFEASGDVDTIPKKYRHLR